MTVTTQDRPIAGRKAQGVELFFAVAPDVPSIVRGDPTRLRQILVNLLGNAIKFTEHGQIQVEVKVEARAGDTVELRFAVRDSGCGISSDKLESIFEERTAKALGKLGVPSAKDVAALHAKIDALSATVAKLTKTAPATAAKKTAAKAAPATKAAAKTPAKKAPSAKAARKSAA